MAKKEYSREDLFGDIHHYDEKGHKTGVSRRGYLGGYTDYDAKGNVTGHTEESILGGALTHYDTDGHVIGRSREQIFGDYTDYDAKGQITGHTHRSILDADLRRLETTNSVYRRSIDPPAIFDEIPSTGKSADTPAAVSNRSSAPAARAAETESSVTRSVLFLALMLFIVVVCVFAHYCINELPEHMTQYYIKAIATEAENCIKDAAEYKNTYCVPGAGISDKEIREISIHWSAEAYLLHRTNLDMEQKTPHLGYRKAWKLASSAGDAVYELSLALSQWDQDGDDRFSPEEIEQVNEHLLDLLPKAEDALARLKTEMEKRGS